MCLVIMYIIIFYIIWLFNWKNSWLLRNHGTLTVDPLHVYSIFDSSWRQHSVHPCCKLHASLAPPLSNPSIAFRPLPPCLWASVSGTCFGWWSEMPCGGLVLWKHLLWIIKDENTKTHWPQLDLHSSLLWSHFSPFPLPCPFHFSCVPLLMWMTWMFEA